ARRHPRLGHDGGDLRAPRRSDRDRLARVPAPPRGPTRPARGPARSALRARARTRTGRRPRAPRRPGPPRARPALARRVPLAAPTAPLGHPRSDDPPHLPHDADVLPVPAVLRPQRARGRVLRWDRRGDRARRALSRRWALRTRRGGPGAPRYPPGFGDE